MNSSLLIKKKTYFKPLSKSCNLIILPKLPYICKSTIRFKELKNMSFLRIIISKFISEVFFQFERGNNSFLQQGHSDLYYIVDRYMSECGS